MAGKRPGSFEPAPKPAGRASGQVPTAAPKGPPSPAPKPPPRQPAAPAKGVDPNAPIDLKGASTGRGLKGAGPAPSAPGAAAPSTANDPGGALSPFQRFAPTADQLGADAAARSNDSMQVMAIVSGLIFMAGATVVVAIVMLVVAWWTMGDLGGGPVAGLDPTEDHIKDTDVAAPIERTQPKPRPGGGGKPAEEPAPGAPAPVFPTTGPATIKITGDILFHSVEINCPASGIRTRASFNGNAATAQGLPIDEDCTVTFQGSQPAKNTIRGNQTKTCTFNPTICKVTF